MDHKLFFSTESHLLIKYVQELYNIKTQIIFDNDKKIFMSKCERDFCTEFILTKAMKSDAILFLINYIKNFHNNNVLQLKRTILIYNFNYVSLKNERIFKLFFEKYSTFFKFIFTTNRVSNIMRSFCLVQHVQLETVISSDFHKIVMNDTDSFIEKLSVDKLDYESIRKDLYGLLIQYFDTQLILKYLSHSARNKFPKYSEDIENCHVMCSQKSKNGNKSILYLENFIFLLIKTCL